MTDSERVDPTAAPSGARRSGAAPSSATAPGTESPSARSPSATSPSATSPAGEGFKHYLATLPRWKKMLLAGATGMVVLGAVALAMEGGDAAGPEPLSGEPSGQGPGEPGGPGGKTALPSTLVPEEKTGGENKPPQNPTDPAWSAAFFRYGFSFFVGFAVGYATRAFLKLVLLVLGAFAVGLFLMSSAGFITVEWQAIDTAFEHFMTDIKNQFGAFRSFITGSLPNAGLAGLGLFAGFRKN